MAGDEAVLKIMFEDNATAGAATPPTGAKIGADLERKTKEDKSTGEKMGDAFLGTFKKNAYQGFVGGAERFGANLGGAPLGAALGEGAEGIAGKFGQGLMKLGAVGTAATAAAGGLVAFGTAVKTGTDYFLGMAPRLAPFSAPVGMAMGADMMRTTMRDFREAQELGPGVAKLYDVTSRMQDDLAKSLLPLKRAFLDVLIPLVEGGADIMKAIYDLIRPLVESLLKGTKQGIDWIKKQAEDFANAAFDANKQLGNIAKDVKKDEMADFNKFVDATIDAFKNVPEGFVNDPVLGGGARGLLVPDLFGQIR